MRGVNTLIWLVSLAIREMRVRMCNAIKIMIRIKMIIIIILTIIIIKQTLVTYIGKILFQAGQYNRPNPIHTHIIYVHVYIHVCMYQFVYVRMHCIDTSFGAKLLSKAMQYI